MKQSSPSLLAIDVTKNIRTYGPQTVTRVESTESYTLTIAITDEGKRLPQGTQANSVKLFFDAIKEIAGYHMNNGAIKCDNNQVSITFANQTAGIERFIADLRRFEPERYCMEKKIPTTSGDMFYKSKTLELSGLELLRQTLINDASDTLIKIISLERREKRFGP